MKTLLRRMKQSLVFRLCYRLVCWINYPTSRERMWHMFAMGKAQGRKEALKTLPIVQVQPKQASEPLHLPPGMWMKHWLQAHPEHRAAIPLQHEPAYWPAPLDDSWLNSKPRKLDPDDTEEVPAIVKMLHQEKHAR